MAAAANAPRFGNRPIIIKTNAFKALDFADSLLLHKVCVKALRMARGEKQDDGETVGLLLMVGEIVLTPVRMSQLHCSFDANAKELRKETGALVGLIN